jgi:hypothetical protein
MAVMERDAWTDERLDDLARRMDKGFDETKGEIREVKGEVSELRKEMNSRFNSIDSRFNSFDARFDALQRTMVLGVISMSATVVGAMLVA